MSVATERFAELVAGPEEDLPLDEAALLIAAHAYPDLDVAAQLARLDDLAAGCAPATVDGLRRHLFDELGFAGNGRRYGDPRNSFLNDVLDRRVGIPISLSVLTLEVGRRLGVDLEGVGMPGHFLVRHVPDGRLIDPFNGGRVLGVQDCARLYRAVHGADATFGPHLLAPVGPRTVLVRMLANLRQLFLAAGDARRAGWAYELRAAVPPGTPADRADVARALASIGRFPEAADVLDELAECVPDAAAGEARARAVSLRALLN
ncbi:MAG TPA: transglutaminase-like domain-containing protein [Acidimicrobiales bacterium]|nr:transglutaminase-like domain-containing protein [Acidimicrobiales bacterium]